jgi:hypothetical protein
MPEVKPVFELHIKPMFRLLDRQHMLHLVVGPGLDLWDYDVVKAHSASILQRVKGDSLKQEMPTVRTGGPWPSEWVSLFDRWIQEGFRRLTLGTARNLKLQQDKDLGMILGCTLDVPGTTDHRPRSWFEMEFIPGIQTAAYKPYFLPAENLSTPTSTIEIHCAERIDVIPPQGITVIDATGTHVVNLPST